MLNGLLRYCKGTLTFHAETASPELFLNRVQSSGVRLWQLKKMNQIVTGKVLPRDYRALSHCAKKSFTRIHMTHKKGLPFLLHRYRKRWGICAGICFFVAFLVISQSFIWYIHFPEYDEKEKQILSKIMADEGLKVGSYFPRLDMKQLQGKVLIESDDLAWVAFNMHGTKLFVELKRRSDSHMPDNSAPCDVIARKTGQIIRISAKNGVKVVKSKEVVVAGDLLISNATIGLNGTTKQVHADGEVIAQTVTKHTLSFPLMQEEKLYTGEVKKRYSIEFLGLRIPLYIAFDLPQQRDVVTQKMPLVLWEQEMPVGLVVEENRVYELQNRSYTEDEAKAVLEQGFSDYEKNELEKSTILSKEDVCQIENDCMAITRTYTCEEDIAQQIALSE